MRPDGGSGQPRLGRGSLIVVATPIGNLGDLSPRAIATLQVADAIYCEDTRHTGRLLEHAGVKAKRLVSLHLHNEAERIAGALERLDASETIALVSDAGTPLVSDPGSRLVAAAIAAGTTVSTVPGPSAVMAALVLSGMDLDRWRFEGFLPRKGPRRRELIEEIASAGHVSVIYESPRRIAETLGDLAKACGGTRRVVMARELTKLHEQIWRGPLELARSEVVDREPRGEYVLVLEGNAKDEQTDHRVLGEALCRLQAAGLARRDAVTAVQVLLGASHNEAYAASLALGDGQAR